MSNQKDSGYAGHLSSEQPRSHYDNSPLSTGGPPPDLDKGYAGCLIVMLGSSIVMSLTIYWVIRTLRRRRRG